ncbi:hypothetical protein CHLNCDRAFT_137776 [Chlorella variabilis]|uniref:ATP-grasp domain-containing protein n=1 Tax=Chlorella variabilis TaxID=554065 RepID=E1Z4H0_CHLVA|nr:hypothetical protein CHLNCDRAFT_137776 [Chlorella variabilis]EFN59059.1 hypothetical protein CHLNCDRAFT_137776 [Chlorella variabilis]|eukprot:XP_005851161.1 hypothetical protein CHLNCDRAFT_137776 [Chlorella variabilis]
MLKAALAGKGGSVPPQEGKLDASSFPCIDEGKPMADDVAATFADLKLSTSTLAGSMPIRMGSYKGSVDYELAPGSLRSAKEIFPASLGDKAAHNFLSEAVVRSLPKGLTATERERVLASTPLSPTLNLLGAMPLVRLLDKVNSRSMEGARLRRHVLRGAVLVFITAGYSSKRFIFERAKELGVRSVVIDGPDSWSKHLVEEGQIEKFVGLDMSDGDTVFDRCLDACHKIKRELGDLDGAVDAARDKHATRALMEEAGLATPRNMLITSADILPKAADHVGFPAVIKPIHGAASLGVLRVDSKEALAAAYDKVCHELAATIIENGVVRQATPEELAQAKSKGLSANCLMEEYLDGPEVDVDLVFSQGEPVYGAVTDNWPTLEPYFNETGSNSPSILPSYQQRELLELAVKSCKALGLQIGVFHVEGKYTSRGPRLIEVNCRMGGGPVRTMNLLAWGVDLVEEQLLASAGIPSRPNVAARPLRNIAEYSVNALRTGRLRDIDFLKPYQGRPDVLYANPLVEAGEKVVCVEDGLPTWICELMVSRGNIHEAIEYVKQIEQEIQKAMVIE